MAKMCALGPGESLGQRFPVYRLVLASEDGQPARSDRDLPNKQSQPLVAPSTSKASDPPLRCAPGN